MNKVMVVEDDVNIRKLVVLYLQKNGYDVFDFEDAGAALEYLEDEEVDIAVVDVMMPGMNGFELTEVLNGDLEIPVILLTAKGQLDDKEQGFLAGASDYIVKPFEPKELLFRIRAVLKRSNPAADTKLSFSGVTLDREHYEIEVAGRTHMLPVKELEMLACLVERPEKVVTREHIAESVWGDLDTSTFTINTHMNRLRQKLEKYDAEVRILTVRGVGYRLERLEAETDI
ncbi:DNA-binding response regulator, OmpR family, contains REC and winged-helix (wHTH) domain [Salinicoccus halodurans]|uniref:Heme response regulator HssR n=2 Tax=Salinicoccus halodurans TaxID=407035 RepID=A0A0F7HJ54_9STAP|nr:response regulator transcription factor [Salinicoccus halodurans]AKG73621.1 heme transporter CcmC [Salinicoccus halodurans]SFK53502.1 DNA-binding response regulator, OmpR family, contains REC and winged-helix (wHTH) domain [Salinicoccus halodurans]